MGTGGASVTSWMDGMKRVGLYRLLKQGEGYPLVEALDDMVADYYLDRLGFYHANFLMSVRSGLGAYLLSAATRILGRSNRNP